MTKETQMYTQTIMLENAALPLQVQMGSNKF